MRLLRPSHSPSCLLPPACLALALLGSLAGARRAAAEDFPPITDEERAIAAVPGEPNAPAVVLFKKGEFLMAGYGLGSGNLASSLRIQVRLKILTEEGKSNGEIAISHSDAERLHGFAGRTVLPDGRVLPISSDARFVRKTSRSLKTFTTAVAFPSVQVGAILDYRYELRFDSPFYLEPWYFSEEIPVRYSEVVFKTMKEMQAQAWSRAPMRVKIQKQTEKSSVGYVTKAWAENVPSVPDDPYGPPYQDLAAQMLLLPTGIITPYEHVTLFESWPKVCELIGTEYDKALRHDGGVGKQAKAVAASGTPREKAQALYRFVRDEVHGNLYWGVGVDADHGVGKILSERVGSRAEKALLLQSMLKAVDIDSRLVWAGDRDRGAIDPQLANPHWFDTVLVLVELDGQRTYLDPSDRALGFGHLRAGYEGSPALIHDPKKPEGVVLPAAPFDQNLERAEIDLALDAKGRLAGTGVLRLTGQQAWPKIDWKDDAAKATQAWKEWLDKRFRDFQISDVKAVESADEEKVTVTWSLAQREEEVLGDEATLVPSAPLGPLAQPFVQPSASRRTGVMFGYPYRQEVELRLRWPEGWKVDSTPQEKNVLGSAAALASSVEVKPAERTLVYRRRLDVTRRQLDTSKEYDALRNLFAEVEKNDAQKLALVRR
ncbi:MAG TPA: DUF3857 domain-containing protein [Thermoanaerobaculia bacterium]|jgi:transglutaminase-like putative cysteine protease